MKLKISLSAKARSEIIDPKFTQVCRGICPSLTIKRKDIRIAQAILNGTLKIPELLKLFDTKQYGTFWYLIGLDDMGVPESEEFAEGEDDLSWDNTQEQLVDYLKNEDGEYDHHDGFYVELPIIVVAERPMDWHPDNNPDDGLMGNSYFGEKWKSLKCVELRYLSGKHGWKVLPYTGKIGIQ